MYGSGPSLCSRSRSDLAYEIFHDQKRPVLRVDAVVVDDDDVRVGQLAGDAGLALEAGVELRLLAQFLVDELDGHLAFQRHVDGAIDLGHAAAAALLLSR